jgi:ketosteroid isomerase-like protein
VTDALELVVRAFLAFERRDPDALAACFHPEGVFEAVTARIAAGGQPYVGHPGLHAYFADIARVWDELHVQPAVFHQQDGAVVATGRVFASAPGRAVDAPVGWLFRISDGLITYARVYETAAEALRENGLR